MKKRSLLAISLVSLVGLVGCGKQASGAAAKCSAAAFDDIVSAQMGVMMGDAWSGDSEKYGPDRAEIKFVMEQKVSGACTEGGYYESYSYKGSFLAVYDSGWIVDEEQEYSEEDLDLFGYILYETPIGYQSWAYLYQRDAKYGAYLEEQCAFINENYEGVDYSVSFTTAPSYTLKFKESGDDIAWVYPEVEDDPETEDIDESEPYEAEVTYTASGSESYAYAQRYGYCTYYLTEETYSQKGVDDKAADGKYSTKFEVSIKYSKTPAEEPEDDLGD